MSSTAIYPPTYGFPYKRQLDLSGVDFDLGSLLELQQRKRCKTQQSSSVYVTIPQLPQPSCPSLPIRKEQQTTAPPPCDATLKREKLQEFVNRHMLSVMLKNDALLQKLCLEQYIETHKQAALADNSYHLEPMVSS